MDNMKEKLIVVVGVSSDENKYGYKIFRDLINAGWNVAAVNPRGGEILGRNVFKNLKELVKMPDMVITTVPPGTTEAIVEECRDLGIMEIWMQPGSESEKAVEKARSYGMKVTFNACFMSISGFW